MTFFRILMEVAPICIPFCVTAYFTERAWWERDRREREYAEDRVRDGATGLPEDFRSPNLYTPLMPGDQSPLPWKGKGW